MTSRTVMGFHAILGINKVTNVAKFQSGVHVKKEKQGNGCHVTVMSLPSL